MIRLFFYSAPILHLGKGKKTKKDCTLYLSNLWTL